MVRLHRAFPKRKWYAMKSLCQKPVDRKFLRIHDGFRRCFGIEVVFASLSLRMLMQACSKQYKGASARCMALGDDLNLGAPGFFTISAYRLPQGHNKKRHRLCRRPSFPASWPGKCLTPISLVDTRNTMEQFKQPAKDQLRQSYHQRQSEPKTPPSMEEVRRQLGWHLCNASSRPDAED
jgi:hypothetical protein